MTSWVSTLRVTSLRLVRSLWYLYGPQGETRQLTNSAGTVTDTYSYTAYGSTVSASGSDANPFQYGGKFGYYTENNGVVLCGHRWYDTLALRWLSRDPIGYKGGSNLYAYCNGDPVNGIDPSGHMPYAGPSGEYTPPAPDGYPGKWPWPPPSNLPGGPYTKWSPFPPGQKSPGKLLSPIKPGSGRSEVQYVPKGAVSNNPEPYWKCKAPGDLGSVLVWTVNQ